MNDIVYFSSQMAREDSLELFQDFGISANKIKEEVPDELYKYSPLNKYALDDLVHGNLTATKPALFNDVYDSILYTNINNGTWEASGEFLSQREIERLNDDTKKSDRKNSVTYQGVNRQILRVVSFSEKFDNNALWGHYANSNTGICVEYDLNSSKLKNLIFPVIYSRQTINWSKYGDPAKYKPDLAPKVSITCSLSKAKIWDYEKEWRVVWPGNISNYYKDHPRIKLVSPKIKRIILGPNFIGHWLKKKRGTGSTMLDQEEIDKIFMPFCKWVKRMRLPYV
ncbi:DUF2971 domain-containing protein [Lentilactobacillus kosonis]|uniref:DUF2971 domain-containing protein n=1 Tax=Lentilactobacillus kosonis TaxID=2810561 RepID=A0A401FHY4_9LACO|nr:DUF2971 domain-containing protein [Lentilactobacillus kosonis]GAY71957.1 hypothetical protein NBRC111893_103 [Lentilactobacillus kosonis]